MSEFDYQWKELASSNKHLAYTPQRIRELLDFTMLDKSFFHGKTVLDAGCGNGRYTWAMQQIGATVDSIDISEEAIIKCRQINPNAIVSDICDYTGSKYDFILSFGALHHMKDPKAGFDCLKKYLGVNGVLHIMVYSRTTQKRYHTLRKTFNGLTDTEKVPFCQELANRLGGCACSWHDALNPKYNYGYDISEIKEWFISSGFTDIKVTPNKKNIHINGVLG